MCAVERKEISYSHVAVTMLQTTSTHMLQILRPAGQSYDCPQLFRGHRDLETISTFSKVTQQRNSVQNPGIIALKSSLHPLEHGFSKL